MDKNVDLNNLKINAKVINYIIIAIVLIVIIMKSFFIIDAGRVGVTFNKITGKTLSHSQGFHFKIPFIVSLYRYDVRTQRVDIIADSASKDLQQIVLDVVLNYHLLYDKVNEVFVKVGVDYVKKVIEPAVNESVKSATAQFPVEDIIVKRQELKITIEKALAERLINYNIVLESVNLININFSRGFNEVVEKKQIEEQKIKTAEYQKRQAEQYKMKTILEAEAEAKKQELMKQMVTPNIISLEWIKKWDGKLPYMMMGDKGMMLVPAPSIKKVDND